MRGLEGVTPLKTAEQHERLKPLHWSSLATLPKREYLIKGVLDKGGLSVLFGPSNCGKSFFAMDMAATLARSLQWRDRRTRGGCVVYIAAEGGLGVRERFEAYCQRHGISPDGTPLYVIPTQADLFGPDDASTIIGYVEELSPVAIFIDTLAATFGAGNENLTVDMNQYIANAQRVREITGAHVQIVHHCGKDESKGARGAYALLASTDTEIEVVADESGNRTATLTKQRDGLVGDEFHFRLEVVELGTDEDGDPVTSCIVVSSDSGPGNRRKGGGRRKITKATKALDVLFNCLSDHGRTAPGTKDYPPGATVVSAETWREELARSGVLSSDNKDTARQQWRRIRNDLFYSERIAEYDGLIWSITKE